jgi:translation initiation factor 4A
MSEYNKSGSYSHDRRSGYSRLQSNQTESEIDIIQEGQGSNRVTNRGYSRKQESQGYNRGQESQGYNRGQESQGYNRGQESQGYNRGERFHGGGGRRGGGGGGGGGGGRRDYGTPRDDTRSFNVEQLVKEAEQIEETINNNNNNNLKSISAEDLARREEYSLPIAEFDELSSLIDLKIIRGVMAYGFESPSPIQQKAIRPLLGKYDVIAQAQSGTGKTATFCIGTLGNLDFTKNETQTIVLAHTMELAQQIEIVFTNIGKYLDLRLGKAVKSLSVRENIDLLTGRNNQGLLPHVVIGTPGRVLDMINKNVIDTRTIKMLIMDEADELLSEGFIHQIKNIISSLNSSIQIGLFSATMEPAFFRITQNFMRNPLNILIKKENLTLEGIKQYYIDCEKNEYKFETLCDLYSLISVSQTLIYCNHYQSVEQLTRKLHEQNFKVSCIHGNMDICQREEAMRKFRNSETRVLISTDLLGRGIDVQQVSIVINYDIPLKIESYIHRIGRSGRHGRNGTAINFAIGNDLNRLNELELYYQTNIEPLPRDVENILASK